MDLNRILDCGEWEKM